MANLFKHSIIIAILLGLSVKAFCGLPDVDVSNKVNKNSEKALELMQSVSKKYQGLSTYQDSGTAYFDYGGDMTMGFSTKYKRPDMVRFEWKGDRGKYFYGTMWTLLNKQIGYIGYNSGIANSLKDAILSNYTNAHRSTDVLNIIVDSNYIDQYKDYVFSYRELNENNIDYYLISAISKQGVVKIEYLIDKANLLIRKITYDINVSQITRKTSIHYNLIKLNPQIDDSVFGHTPPVFSLWTIQHRHLDFFLTMVAIVVSIAISVSLVIQLWNRISHRTLPTLESLYSSYKRFLLVTAKVLLIIFLVLTCLAFLFAMIGSGDMAGIFIVFLPVVGLIIVEIYCLLVCFLLCRYLTYKFLGGYKKSSASIN